TMQHTFQHLPEYIVADAGYGSESNYECIVDTYERQALIPYNTYYKEQKKRYKTDEMHPNHWEYNAIDDYYVCPNERRLPLKRHTTRTDKYGYQRRSEERRVGKECRYRRSPGERRKNREKSVERIV